MPKNFVEHRQLNGEALTWDLAHHLCMRYNKGPVVVITDKPNATLAALRKQWLRIVLKLRNEYSRTLNTASRQTIQAIIQQMEDLPFILEVPPKQVKNTQGVYLVLPGQIEQIQMMSHTIYVTCDDADMTKLATHVEERGLLAKYVD